MPPHHSGPSMLLAPAGQKRLNCTIPNRCFMNKLTKTDCPLGWSSSLANARLYWFLHNMAGKATSHSDHLWSTCTFVAAMLWKLSHSANRSFLFFSFRCSALRWRLSCKRPNCKAPASVPQTQFTSSTAAKSEAWSCFDLYIYMKVDPMNLTKS